EDSEKVDGSVSKQKCARDVVTPLADIPYAEQLEQKKNSLSQLLKRLTRNAKKACPNGVPLPQWINKSREIGGLPCKLEGILDSPLTNGYRNKCEFSVGYSVSGKVTVGFMLGNFREGVTAVEEPVNCPNVSNIASRYASIFQEFLRESSLPVWNRFKNTGFWRQLTVREGRNPQKEVDFENPEANILEVMLVIQICSSGLGDDIINSELKRMSESFATEAISSSPPLPLTALVVQDHQGISNAAPADAPLRPLIIPTAQTDSSILKACTAEARIHDYISSLRFSISPTAFFQVNTLAAEKLYSLAGDWASLDSDTLLFDVCCGTGTIGLTLAPRVGMVVGIEMNASAVSDAQRNAEINGIKNCRFVCAKAEDVLDSLLNEYLNELLPMDEDLDLSERDETNPTSAENGSNPDEPLCEKVVEGVDASGPDKKELELPEAQPAANGAALMQQSFKNVVAIVDPPRGGLHPTVIKALRTHPWLRRLVYISCNPETLVANAIELCTPSTEKTEKGNKRNQGWRNMSSAGLARHRAKSMPMSEPFVPIKAMAVDLFPHTHHCEMVMLLER
ncbi:Zinc finger CCCH domain-containing protein, partial [Drosera capensis]